MTTSKPKDKPGKTTTKPNASKLKEVRLRRRKKEKETLSISTNVDRVDSYRVTRKVESALLQSLFKEQRDIYTDVITRLVASHMAMATAVNNVIDAAKEANPDTIAADSLFDSIDSAWDLATSAVFLESAFVSAGYEKEPARTLAQAILLKRSDPPPASAPSPTKKDEKSHKMEDVVEAVRNDLNRMGLKISKSLPAKPDLPNSRRRKQAE